MKLALFAFILTSMLLAGTAFANPDATNTLDLDRPIARIGEVLSRNLEPSTVIGAPVTIGELTLIPLVSKGFGFGLGGGSSQRGETGNHDKDAKEVNNDYNGLGCGAGGFMKIVAILVVRKDGTFQIHRMQESFLAQMASHYAPVALEMIKRFFEYRLLKIQKGPEGPLSPPAPAH